MNRYRKSKIRCPTLNYSSNLKHRNLAIYLFFLIDAGTEWNEETQTYETHPYMYRKEDIENRLYWKGQFKKN